MNLIVKLFKILTFGIFNDYIKIVSKRRHKKRMIDKAQGKVDQILEKNEVIKLEIGAGEKKGKNGWVTLDRNDSCDLNWDLRNGIPFPDSSISKIYSSHLFEHLSFKQAKGLFQECKRVLKEGGIFSICVPNARLFIEAYANNDSSYWEKSPSYYDPARNHTTNIDLINYIAYMDDEHKYMFDEENLVHILNANGFNNVKLREFDSEVDMKERDHESIYAEGIK